MRYDAGTVATAKVFLHSGATFMSDVTSNRALFATALVLATVLATWKESALRAGDESAGSSAAGKSAKAPTAAKDLFTVPEGKPPALLAFIAKIRRIKPPKNASEDEKNQFLINSHKAMLDAANKILDASPTGSQRVAALKAKVEALVALDELGDDQAKKQLGDLADELKDDKQMEIAKLVKPFIGFAAKSAGANPDEPKSWAEIKPKLVAAPEDKALASLALKAVGMMGQGPEAVKAYRELQAIFTASKDPQIAAAAKKVEGVVRRLTLIGKPMEIHGQLVDGTPANPAALRGKVVLVDFWATWCGPCKEELPNVLANYGKYHNRGFEVVGVSLDEDKPTLIKFLEEQRIPWPILFGDAKQKPGMAEYYGVTGIPTAILANQRGEVVSLNARGPELTRQLEMLLGK
jgi:thiol-disulfide isomerase/thioredoxin